jgi:hypothetical protein
VTRTEAERAIAPVVKELTVNAPIGVAFRTFTREMGMWWPTTGVHAVHAGEVESILFEEHEGGRVVERSRSAEAEWARVTIWQPPTRLVLAWKPNPDRAEPTEVEVTFEDVAGDRTRVRLEHRGWERLGTDGAEQRASYDSGWDPVLERFIQILA